MLNATVGAGQLGMHMLFDWNGVNNLDVFVVLGMNNLFGDGVVRSDANASTCDTGGIQNCLWNGAGTGVAPPANHIWMLASVDGNGDGVMGIPMVSGGPFAGWNVNISTDLSAIAKADPLVPTPVPAAIWLFGSEFAGLMGMGRIKKRTEC